LRDLIADLFVTLDGFAAGEDVGPFFGYAGPELDAWVESELARPQVVVLGRVTYEALARISAGATDPVSAQMTALPKLVVSSSLEEPLAWPNTQLLRGGLAQEISSLKRQEGPPLRTIGSISLVASLAELLLVDRLRLMVFPLTLGERGREPVFARFAAARLDLLDTTVLDSRFVLLEYRPRPKSRATRIARHLRAPRAAVYRALVEADAIARWKFPTGMTSHIHEFDGREGGSYRISLTYDAPTGTGKTSAHTDTYHGRFVELVPNERVVEIDEFETEDPALQGEMRATITLADADDGGTNLTALHEDLPPGVALADNDVGWSQALDRLAAMVE
jgi:uncharacterized protein YndB with AHSA1/START domain/dihydrofolate reductase